MYLHGYRLMLILIAKTFSILYILICKWFNIYYFTVPFSFINILLPNVFIEICVLIERNNKMLWSVIYLFHSDQRKSFHFVLQWCDDGQSQSIWSGRGWTIIMWFTYFSCNIKRNTIPTYKTRRKIASIHWCHKTKSSGYRLLTYIVIT